MSCLQGTDVRRLILDGAAPKHVFGLELNPDFVAAGLQLYDDEAASSPVRQRFYVADALAKTDSKSRAASSDDRARFEKDVKAVGGVDVIFTSAVYHLMTLEQTEALVSCRLILSECCSVCVTTTYHDFCCRLSLRIAHSRRAPLTLGWVCSSAAMAVQAALNRSRPFDRWTALPFTCTLPPPSLPCFSAPDFSRYQCTCITTDPAPSSTSPM